MTYDTGDKSIQCGRKVDGFKLWIMWKARGDEGFAALVDNTFECAEYLYSEMSMRKGFKPVISKVQNTNVSFWYVPESLRNQEESDEWWANIAKVSQTNLHFVETCQKFDY
jgi:glutamate/tyrosine decarboxylase-like PLP-dependent enzyme